MSFSYLTEGSEYNSFLSIECFLISNDFSKYWIRSCRDDFIESLGKAEIISKGKLVF